jgi:hypothetical protein
MQAAHLLLHQYRLLHLQVCILQAKDDLVFLGHLAKMMELLRPGTRGVHPGKEVPLDSLSLDALGAFPAIQLPPSVKELLLQLDSHRQHGHHIKSRRCPT